MATTPATEHATLADQRVKAKDIAGLEGSNAKFSSVALHRKYPFITKATFDSAKTRINS